MSKQYKKLKALRKVFYKSLFAVSERLKHKYAHQGGGEAALRVAIMAQAAYDGDLEYFESESFRHHCNEIPASFILDLEDVEGDTYKNFMVDLSTYIATSNFEKFLSGCRCLYFIRGVD
jgi:hypothetical protein